MPNMESNRRTKQYISSENYIHEGEIASHRTPRKNSKHKRTNFFNLKQLWYDNKNYNSLPRRKKIQVMLKTSLVTSITLIFLMAMSSMIIGILTAECNHNWERISCVQEKCTRCSETRYIGTHQGVFVKTIPPSCTQSGYSTYLCSTCKTEYQAEYVQPIGHSTKNGVCSYCGKTITLADSCELEQPLLYTKYSHKNVIAFSTAELIDLDYEFVPFINDTVVLNVSANFKKTYDYDGENGNAAIRLIWRLYDSSGKMVDGQTVESQGLLTGQEAGLTITSKELSIGKYRLEFSDYGK